MSIRVRDNTAAALVQMNKVHHSKLQKFAQNMCNAVKRNSPVGWGRFYPLPGGPKTPMPRGYVGSTNRKSITWDEISAMVFRIFSQSGYGAYLELGTAHMAARPYFRPAFDATKAELQGGKL